MRKKPLIKWLLVLTGLYVAGGFALILLQDLLLFHPKPLPPDHRFSFNQPFEEWNFDRQGRNLHAIRFKTEQPKKGIVLYFHGNMHNVERYAPAVPFFTNNGYELWMMDYPGFGKSTGKRTEERMYDDAVFLYQKATAETSSNQLVIYGRSIGTGVASYLASKYECNQLILETPYTSIHAMAKRYFPIYPVTHLLKYSFPTIDRLQTVKAPVTLIHGTKDEVIPYEESMLMKKKFPGIGLITIRGGLHNNLSEFPDYKKTIDSLLYQDFSESRTMSFPTSSL